MPLGLLPAMAPRSLVRSSSPVEACAPPAGFRAAEGVRSAWLSGEGPFGRTPRRGGTSAQRAGLRYEKKAQQFLRTVLGPDFKKSQWFRFWNGNVLRWCEVDGLLVDQRGAVIFEIKNTFCSDAWYQLRKLYEPVVRRAFVLPAVRLVVVCKYFDPSTPFPEPYQHTELIGDWRESFSNIGVFQWKP